MDTSRAVSKYGVPALVLAAVGPQTVTRFFIEGTVTEWFGPNFPYGWVTVCALCYLAGLKFVDWWPTVVRAYKNWGVHFSIEAMRGLDGSAFRSVPYQDRNYIVLPFSIRNKSKKKHISNIRIMAKITNAANNLLNAPIQQEFLNELHFDDGRNSMNPDTSHGVILAHEACDDYGIYFGSPESPLSQIHAGLMYTGVLEISGNGSRTKRVEFQIEALQYTNPTFILRRMDFDEENAKF